MTLFLNKASGKTIVDADEVLLDFKFKDIQKMPIGTTFTLRVLEDQEQRFKVEAQSTSIDANHPLFDGPFFYMRSDHHVFTNVDFDPKAFEERDFSPRHDYYITFRVEPSLRNGYNRLRIESIKVYDGRKEEWFTVKNDHA